MTANVRTKFSAADSALGYLYQCGYALLAALERLSRGDDFALYLETLDDVVFVHDGRPDEILQTKCTRQREASLTDASEDLWKTLRIWIETPATDGAHEGRSLFLVTTATAGPSSAASHLRCRHRDVDAALARLVATVQSSTSKRNYQAYAAFRALPEESARALLNTVFVLDSAATVEDLDNLIYTKIRPVASPRFREPVLDQLLGWWLRQVVRHLAQGSPTLQPLARAADIEDQISVLREQFRLENLPIDEELKEANVDPAIYADRAFMRQLGLIAVGPRRRLIAAQNYFRASEQRSRWISTDLCQVGELGRYDRRLIEEWTIHFEQERERLASDADEAARTGTGKRVYEWAETASIPIRRDCIEPFITRGSYHLLADDEQNGPPVGWHPNYRERLGTGSGEQHR